MLLNNTHFFIHIITVTLGEEKLFESYQSHYIEESIDCTLLAAFEWYNPSGCMLELYHTAL